MIVEIIVAMVSVLAFGVSFHIPKSEYLYCALNGGLGWAVYRLCQNGGFGPTASALWAALVLTLAARILSAVRKMPSTVFLIAGIFSLVPGSGIYYTSYYIIMNELSRGSSKGIETFKVAGAIVLGILFGLALPQNWFNHLGRITDRKIRGQRKKKK
ncbi:threonine/serine exporter [Lachnospiraceae bacterium]|nr:threonine/serine exporter [Lachnospiraceae bacterium]